MASSLEQNKEVVREFFRRLQAGDVGRVVALFAPQATFWAPSTRRAVDIETFGESLRRFGSFFKKMPVYELGATTAEEDRVAVLVEARATTVSGCDYHNLHHFYFELEGGRIVTAREYGDTRHLQEALDGGAGDRPPASGPIA